MEQEYHLEFEKFWSENWKYAQGLGIVNEAFKEIALKAFKAGQAPPVEASAAQGVEMDAAEKSIRENYSSSTDWEWIKHLLDIIDTLRSKAKPVSLSEPSPGIRDQKEVGSEASPFNTGAERTAEPIGMTPDNWKDHPYNCACEKCAENGSATPREAQAPPTDVREPLEMLDQLIDTCRYAKESMPGAPKIGAEYAQELLYKIRAALSQPSPSNRATDTVIETNFGPVRVPGKLSIQEVIKALEEASRAAEVVKEYPEILRPANPPGESSQEGK